MYRHDISEIRRRLNPEKNNITCIRGCYVNSRGEIISKFNRELISMPQEEAEKYLALFKRVLSGTLGKNLVDVVFEPYQVMDSPEHKALMQLRDMPRKALKTRAQLSRGGSAFPQSRAGLDRLRTRYRLHVPRL